MTHRTLRFAVVLTAGALLLTSCDSRMRAGSGGLGVGQPAPKIEADGWLNDDPPTEAERKGKVVVVEAWASWCGPCRKAAPHMVRVYNKFQPQGVVFIGLSSEDSTAISAMQKFLTETEIKWPNGYGAMKTLKALGADRIPSTWVIGRDGKIAWNGTSKESLEDGIAAALSAK